MKKVYIKPTLKVVMIENADLICTSLTGYSVNYKDEDGDEGVSTVHNTIWDR